MVEKRNTKELMEVLELEEGAYFLARGNWVRWYGRVLCRSEDDELERAMDFKINRKRKKERPKPTWKRKMEQDTEKLSWINERNGEWLKKMDTTCNDHK